MQSPLLYVPRLVFDSGVDAVIGGGSGPTPPVDYTTLEGINGTNKSVWATSTNPITGGDLLSPTGDSGTNIVATIKAVFEYDADAGADQVLIGHLGSGGWSVGIDSNNRIEALVDFGSGGIYTFVHVTAAYSPGDVIFVHVVLDSAGGRMYVNGEEVSAVAVTTGYEAANSAAIVHIGQRKQFSASVPDRPFLQNFVAASIRRGTALTISEVVEDIATTSPSDLHLASANYAWAASSMASGTSDIVADIGGIDLLYADSGAGADPTLGTAPYVQPYVASTNFDGTNNNAYYRPGVANVLGSGPSVIATLKYVGVKVSYTDVTQALLFDGSSNGWGLRIASRDLSFLFDEASGALRQALTTGDLWNTGVAIGDVFVLHVVMDGTNATLYLNGASAASVGYDGGMTASTRDFCVGHAPGNNLNGSAAVTSPPVDVGHIAFSWIAGTALSAPDVASDFAATAPGALHLLGADYGIDFEGITDPATAIAPAVGSGLLSYNTTAPGDPAFLRAA